jgi:hypothetical protein
MNTRTTQTEWRVETDRTEDDFGADEDGAREWLARTEDHPDWLPAVLMRRTVTVETSEWEAAL